MSRTSRIKLIIYTVLIVFCSASSKAQDPKENSEVSKSSVRYTVSLAQKASHLVHVRIDLPAGAEDRDLQLPVWNALYQMRDFSQYVNWIKAENLAGDKLPLRKLNKSLWRVSGAENGARIDYAIFANDSGPYGAELNQQHAFFNLAELLMYPVDFRSLPVQLRFTDVPLDWKIATPLAGSFNQGFTAERLRSAGRFPSRNWQFSGKRL